MEKTTSHVLIEAIIRSAMKEMEDSPKRSIRKLVDMALQFASGTFQTTFFETVQTMLEDESSAYYALIQDVCSHTDHDTLVTTGINAGFNGCTIGAERIRRIQRDDGYRVPWMVSLHIDTDTLLAKEQRYHEIIEQGEQLGVFDWQIFTPSPKMIFPLIQKHPDSAFVLYCDPAHITAGFLDSASLLKNLMIAVTFTENVGEACDRLRRAKLLYSVCYPYRESSLTELTSGDLWADIQQLHPIFTILMAAPDCPETFRQRVYNRVLLSRSEQRVQTILWEADRDSQFIANVMAPGSVPAGFDEKGQLFTSEIQTNDLNSNLFHEDLSQIFRNMFPADM